LGRKLPKSFEPIDVSTAKSKASDSTSRKKTTGRKEKQKEPINKSEVKGKCVSVKVTSEVEDHLRPGRALYVRWTAS
jgi:histone-lysine N-methyltransferase SETD2